MWYKKLKVKKNATRLEVENAYAKLSSNPKYASDLTKALELQHAYNEAIAHFDKYGDYHYKPSTSKFKSFIINIVCLIIIFALIFMFIIRPLLSGPNNEITKCLAHGSQASNPGYDYDEVQNSLVENGYGAYYYHEGETSTIQYSNKVVDDKTVEFHYQRANTRGFCVIEIEKKFEVELDGETQFFTVSVRNNSESLDLFTIDYKLSPEEYTFDHLYKTHVYSDFTKDDIELSEDFDNEEINKYYNYEYLRNVVDTLIAEIEQFKAGE